MNFQTMNKQRKFILIAAAVGVIAMFLPWVRIEFFGISNSVNGFHDIGFLIFLCFVGAGVVAFLGDQTKSLDKTFWFIALACGGVAALIMVINFIRALDVLSYVSIGFYLALLASLGVLGAAYMFRSPGDSIKGGFDSLKNDIEKKTDGNPNT
jgi:uncharacterized membrane protein